MAKVALITGGASGMGLAVARALAPEWELHIVDVNRTAGEAAARSLPATFYQANITVYSELAAVFKAVFQANGRLDFVFANAGIAEKANFYAAHDTGVEPPPEPSMLCTQICFDSVITTAYLAQHYFRQSPKEADHSIVMTASCGGIYPSYYSPTYTAAKTGVVGFMRGIAKHFWTFDRIRVNAICPGTVKTSLLTAKEWQNFPEAFFTPIEKIVETVVMLVEGRDKLNGRRIDGEKREKKGVLWGETVEISGVNHYYREAPEACDNAMQEVMKATDIEELAR